MESKSGSIQGWSEIAIYLVLLLTFVLLAMTTIYTGFDSIYAQLFLVPVTLAGLWNGRKGILVAVLYGLQGIALSWFAGGQVSTSVIFQAAVFLIIAIAVGIISDRKNKVPDLISKSEEKTEAENRKAQAALQKSRDLYATLLESFPGLIWRSDRGRKGVYFSRNWLDYTGRSLEEELGDGWQQSVHEADLGPIQQAFLNAEAAAMKSERVFRLRRKDGVYRWMLETCRPYPDTEGNFAGYVSFVFDITGRRVAAEELDARNRELHMMNSISAQISQYEDIEEMFARMLKETNSLISAAAGGIFLEDESVPGVMRLAARAPAEDIQAKFLPEIRLSFRAPAGDLITATTDACECLEQGSSPGQLVIVPVKSTARRIGAMVFYYPCEPDACGRSSIWDHGQAADLITIGSRLGTAIDCATQYIKLMATNDYLSDIIEESPDAMLTLDATGNIGRFNKKACRLLKYTPGEVAGRHISTILPPGSNIGIYPDHSYVRDFRAHDDSLVKLNISAASLPGTTGGFIVTLKDLSAVTGLKIVPVSHNTQDTDQRYHFKRGVIYLIDKQKIDYHMDIFLEQAGQNSHNLCISRQYPKLIRDRYAMDKTPVIWLSNGDSSEGKNIKPGHICDLTTAISEFVDNNDNSGTIMLDGMEYLITHNGFDMMLKFVQFLNDKIMVSNCSAMICLDTATLDDRQRHLLLSEMTEFRES